MSLQPLDELFKVLKDERVAELLEENERLRQELDKMKATNIYRIDIQNHNGILLSEHISICGDIDIAIQGYLVKTYENISGIMDLKCEFKDMNIMRYLYKIKIGDEKFAERFLYCYLQRIIKYPLKIDCQT